MNLFVLSQRMFGMRADPEEESRKAAERKARRVKIAQELKEKARTGP